MSKAAIFLTALSALSIATAASADPEPQQPSLPASPPPADSAPPPAEPTPGLQDAGPAVAAAEPAAQAMDQPLVVYIQRPKQADFVAMTAGSAVFGMIGALAAISAGKDIVVQNDLKDPAIALVADVAKLYAASKNARVGETPVMITDEHPKKIVEIAQGAKYVVDLRTTAWTSIYFPLDWSHYGLMYGATLRIIDGSTGEVVVSGRCFIKPVQAPDSPTHDEMMADQAAGLKKMVAVAGEACLTELKTRVLKL